MIAQACGEVAAGDAAFIDHDQQAPRLPSGTTVIIEPGDGIVLDVLFEPPANSDAIPLAVGTFEEAGDVRQLPLNPVRQESRLQRLVGIAIATLTAGANTFSVTFSVVGVESAYEVTFVAGITCAVMYEFMSVFSDYLIERGVPKAFSRMRSRRP